MRILLLTALVGCTPFSAPEPGSFAGDDTGSERAAGVVRVATWNIETVGTPGSFEYEAALEVVARIDADVLALNEIDGSWDTNNAFDFALDAGFEHVVVGGNGFGSDRNAVLSRYPFSFADGLDAAEVSGDPQANDITREFVLATVETPGGPLDVAAMHWKSGWDDDDEFRRVLESHRAAQLVHDAHPVLLTGDWNDDIRDNSDFPWRFDRLPNGLPSSFWLADDLWNELNDIGLPNDAFLPLEDAGMNILDARQRSGTDATRPVSGRRIDYIAATPDLEIRGTEVFDCRDEHLDGELRYAGSPVSSFTCGDAADHLPVIADVFLGETGEPLNVDTVAAGDLVISELLANPNVCFDSDGEWVELLNTSALPIELEGVELIDASGHIGRIDGGVVAPGEHFVVGRGASPCGGVADASYTSSFSLNNGGDTAWLMAGDEPLDVVVYTRSGAAGDLSWSHDDGDWCTTIPSPGAANSCD